MRFAEELRVVASLSPDASRTAARLADLVRNGDDLSALAAVHALGAITDPLADLVLLDLVLDAQEPFAAHAAWAFGARRSSPQAVAGLADLIAGGGFTAMLAERTLIEWSRNDADPLRADQGLRSDSLDVYPVGDGIVVIQPFLHARLDRNGSALGSGDAGGIASLLRSLGNALVQVDDVDEVITVTRRHDSECRSELLASGHRVERIDVGPAGALPWREAWAYRTQIEQQFLELGRSLAGRRVVWHLRMADVGTLAASAAARRLGQPMVFTAAPDPHIVIDALQDSDRLDRTRFGVEDASAQFWFRARMVERLTAQADRLVLLPRPTIEQELINLVGVDPTDLAARSTVVPEGVDVAEIESARDRLDRFGPSEHVRRVLDSLPTERRGLPWLLTVGRLNPTKGPQRIVDAVVGDGVDGDGDLADRVNVVIVGGDIEHPSPDEQSTIELIRRAADGANPSLVTLTGHLPPAAVSDLLVFVSANAGVYVCASDKEEFGLAIVEALAAGAVVIAPERGGPRTYVVDGDTGVLCDTLSVHALRRSIRRTLELAGDLDRADRARAMVHAELSVDRMARRLGEVYRELLPSVVNA